MAADLLPEKWMKAIAVTTTVLAVVASIASSRSAFFIAKAQLLTALEGSKWSYFQAKSIKQNLAETQQKAFQINLLGTITPQQKDLLARELKDQASNIARYEQEKAAIKKDAEDTNRENALVVRRGSQFSLAVVFSQIGIMLSSVGALLRRKEMWVVGLIIGTVSLIYLANGFLLSFDMAVNIPLTSKPRIVIVGAGFAGIELAKALANEDAQVVLIDQNNHHTFQPLLYQVATAGLEPNSIAYPVREIFRDQKGFIFRMARVLEVKPDANCVVTSIGDISYDHLVIATGARSNFFGMDDLARHAMCMKDIADAIALRNAILESFEKAVLTTSLEDRERLMTFVLIGGGPTGVELAGALGELKHVVLPHDHPELDFKKMSIHLVDMEDRLLKAMSPDSSRSAEKFLVAHDVNVWLNAKVLSYDGMTVRLSNGKSISTQSVIWAAGVAGAVIPGLNPEAVAGSRIKTDGYNRVQGCSNIFAIGDVACVVSPTSPRGHPMLASVAIQQGKNLAGNFKLMLKKKGTLRPFSYQDLGIMATVGRHHAVAELFFGKFQGLVAWVMWAALHLVTLVGFRNKLVAMVTWTWGYFRYDQGLRLIIRPLMRKGDRT